MVKKFTQMNDEALKIHSQMIRTNPAAAALITVMVRLMSPKDNVLVCSYSVFEKETGFKRNAIYNGLQYLESINWIKIYKVGRTNVYAINSEVAWKYHQDNTWRAKFSATIVLDSTEQTNNIYPVKQLVNLEDLQEVYGGSDD